MEIRHKSLKFAWWNRSFNLRQKSIGQRVWNSRRKAIVDILVYAFTNSFHYNFVWIFHGKSTFVVLRTNSEHINLNSVFIVWALFPNGPYVCNALTSLNVWYVWRILHRKWSILACDITQHFSIFKTCNIDFITRLFLVLHLYHRLDEPPTTFKVNLFRHVCLLLSPFMCSSVNGLTAFVLVEFNNKIIMIIIIFLYVPCNTHIIRV